MARYGAIEEATLSSSNTVYVKTSPCVLCGKQHEFMLRREGYEAWQTDTKIQDALPELSAADREILISGTCDECFDKLFPPEEE